MADYVTADPHFSHERIIEYTNRPFKSVEEMNRELIKRWNDTVKKDDKVFVLGDVGFGNVNTLGPLIGQLNGYKVLVYGNHDKRTQARRWFNYGFSEVSKYPIIYEQFVIMSHEPVTFLGDTPFVNLYGHVHDKEAFPTFTKRSCCVCVERWDYRPVLLKSVLEKMVEQDALHGKIT